MTRPDRASATLFAVSCLALLLVLGGALGVVAAMVRSHRIAQSAADLSALAGAQTQQEGGAACVAAERIARANAASMTGCRVAGSEVTVRVSVSGPRWLGQTGDLVAEARAGPG